MIAVGVGLLPAIVWGIMPVALYYFKGSVFEQLMGTTMGTLIMALLFFICEKPILDGGTFFLALLSGMAWSIGQAGQYWSYSRLGVSKVFPISTGLQIVGNSVIGGLGLREWQGNIAVLKGFIGMFIIVIGILASNIVIGQHSKPQNRSIKDYMVLVTSTVGYWGYSFFPKLINHENPVAALLPQAIGMVLMALIVVKILIHNQKFSSYRIRLNIIGGLLFGVAAMAYLASIALNGLVNAFLMSQLNMVIATLLGIYLLKESQQVSVWHLYTGLLLIVIGGLIIVLP